MRAHPSPLVKLIIAPKRMSVLQKQLPLEFMDGLSYTTIIEFAEPPACLSRRSRAKTDRRGSQLRFCRATLRQAALDYWAAKP